MDKEEFKDIIISVAALTFAFAILMGNGNLLFIPYTILPSFLAVILCFFPHELAHRAVARHFEFYARYIMWPLGLLFAIISAFLGFLFAAPGAVYVYPYSRRFAFQVVPMTRRENGLISLAGPSTNMLIGFLMLVLYYFTNFSLFAWIASLSFWFAVFNLIPFPPLDGSKVFAWSPKIWACVFFTALIGWKLV